jgi:hypothetical protein
MTQPALAEWVASTLLGLKPVPILTLRSLVSE